MIIVCSDFFSGTRENIGEPKGFVVPLQVYHHLRNANSVVDLLEQPPISFVAAPPPPVEPPERTPIVPCRAASILNAVDPLPSTVVRRSVETQTTSTSVNAATQTTEEDARPVPNPVPIVKTGSFNTTAADGAAGGRVSSMIGAIPAPPPMAPSASPAAAGESRAQRCTLDPLPRLVPPAMDVASQRSHSPSEDTMAAFRTPPNPESQHLARCLLRATPIMFGESTEDVRGKKQRTNGDNESIASGISDFQMVYRSRLRCAEIASND